MLWLTVGAIVKRRIRPTPIDWHCPGICPHHCAAIPGAVRALHMHYPDRPVSFQDTVPLVPVLPPRRTPRKAMGHPPKGVRATTRRTGGVVARNALSSSYPLSLALFGHPRCCGAISGAVEPCVDRTSPRRLLCDQSFSLSKTLDPAWVHPRVSVRTTTGRKRQ
jgi:hypothetical protein